MIDEQKTANPVDEAVFGQVREEPSNEKNISDAEMEAARHRDLLLLMEQLETELCH